MDNKKPWYEKANIWISITAGIFGIIVGVFSILGVSVFDEKALIVFNKNSQTEQPSYDNQKAEKNSNNTDNSDNIKVDDDKLKKTPTPTYTPNTTITPTNIPTPNQTPRVTYSKYIRIISKTVNVKKTPNEESKKVGVLHSGDVAISLCETTSEYGGIWHKIVTGRIYGYIPSKCAEIVDSDEKEYVQLSDGRTTLNVRDYPKPDAHIITQISNEYKYEIIKEVRGTNDETWYKILIDDQTNGYVDSRFVEVVE